MSFGKMTENIEIITTAPTKDTEGFVITADTIIARIRAYFEPRNGTEKWRNNAVFAEASVLFRFRKIPGVTIDTAMMVIHNGERYNIISAEDVRGKGMYLEILGKQVMPSKS